MSVSVVGNTNEQTHEFNLTVAYAPESIEIGSNDFTVMEYIRNIEATYNLILD